MLFSGRRYWKLRARLIDALFESEFPIMLTSAVWRSRSGESICVYKLFVTNKQSLFSVRAQAFSYFN